MLRKLVVIMMIALTLTACSPNAEEAQDKNEIEKSEETGDQTEVPVDDSQDIEGETVDTDGGGNHEQEGSDSQDEQDPDLEEEEEEEPVILDGVYSPLSGILFEREDTENRPVSIMLDNHPSARWQAGICKAEIVYECEVEYPYTRYMAVFMCQAPEHIGPVRSARPYYLRYALEYDSMYVHVGGSQEALGTIIDYNMADLDGLTSGEFWRYYKTGKEIPNNMYTAMENIRSAQSYLKYRQTGNFEGFNFHEELTDLDLQYADALECQDLKITYNKSYVVDYEYSNGNYKRYVNGERQLDEYYEEKINASNIIIQKVKKEVVDSYGRIHLDTVSEGGGYFITDGKCIEIDWKKDSYKSKTLYMDSKGNEITLNPGQTWIQVVSQDSVIEF